MDSNASSACFARNISAAAIYPKNTLAGIIRMSQSGFMGLPPLAAALFCADEDADVESVECLADERLDMLPLQLIKAAADARHGKIMDAAEI